MPITLPVEGKADNRSFEQIANQAEKRFTKAGQDSGKAFAKNLEDAAAKADPKSADKWVRAYDKVADATGKVRVEEAKLADLRERGASNARLIAQSEALERARRGEIRATNDAATAYRNLSTTGSTAMAGLRDFAANTRFGPLIGDVEALGARFGGMGLAVGGAIAGVAGIAVVAAQATRALYDMGAQWDAVFDNIQIKTGASGEALDALKQSTMNVASSVPVDIGKVGDVVGETSRALKITGQDLDLVAGNIANLGRLTGEDVNVRQLGQAFRMFGVDALQMVPALDSILQASQTSGMGVNELIGSIQKGGYQLQQFGFDFGQSAALITNFEQIGIDADSVMGPLTKSLAAIAKEGKEPRKVLEDTVTQVKALIDAGKDPEAQNLVNNLFGNKGGLKVFESIKNGALDVSTFNDGLKDTGVTIQGLAEDTDNFSEHWKQFTNQAKVTFQPLTQAVYDFADGALVKMTDILTGPMDQAKVEAEAYADALRAAATVADGLGTSIEKVKVQGQNVVISVADNTPEVQSKLGALGMRLEAMADDPTNLKIVADTPEAERQLEAWRRRQEGLPLTVPLGIKYDAGVSWTPEWMTAYLEGRPLPAAYIPANLAPGGLTLPFRAPDAAPGPAPGSTTVPAPAGSPAPAAVGPGADWTQLLPTRARGGIAGRSGSGRLFGPGSGTSDSILGVDPRTGLPTAWVSAGEGVVTAAAMSRPGVAGLVGALNGYASGTGVTSEIDWVAQVARDFGLQMTSGRRNEPGSYHNSGQAGDFSNGGGNTPQMRAFAEYMSRNFGGLISELIYSDGSFAGQIGDGKNVSGTGYYSQSTLGQHENHVHIALQPGALNGVHGMGATGGLTPQNGGMPVYVVGAAGMGAPGSSGPASAGAGAAPGMGGQIGAPVASDFGISGGLPGVAQNLTTMLANFGFAPMIGALSGVKAGMDPTGSAGSGLFGIMGALGGMGGASTVSGFGTVAPTNGIAAGGNLFGGGLGALPGPAQESTVGGIAPAGGRGEGGLGIGGGLAGMAMSAIQAAAGAGGMGANMMAPGAGAAISAAADIGIKLANRGAQFAGQAAGIGVGGLMEAFLPVDSALADPMNSWFGRIVGGMMGAAPQLPNMAGQPANAPQNGQNGGGQPPADGKPPITVNYTNNQATEDRAGADLTNHLMAMNTGPGQ